MLEKLEYDMRNNMDVQESKKMASLSNNKEGLNSNNESRAKVDGYQKSLSEKEETIQQLTSQVDKSRHTLFVYYQKSLSVKDETIQQLTVEVDKLNKSTEEYQKRLSEEEDAVSERDEIINQLTSKIYNLKVFTEEYQKSLSEKNETVDQVTARLDSQNVITLEQLTDEEKVTSPPKKN